MKNSDSLLQNGILVLDFGSQYTLLIARRIRELDVYCEIWPCNDPRLDEIAASGSPPAKGLILSGGPSSVTGEDAPIVAKALLNLGVPVLGSGYRPQLM